MFHFLRSLTARLTLFVFVLVPGLPLPQLPPGGPQTDRIIVKLSQKEKISEITQKHNLQNQKYLERIDAFVLTTPGDANQVVPLLRRERVVVSVELDHKAAKTVVGPNDASYSQQWALPKISWHMFDATSSAFNPATRTVVAVVDTGVDYNHPDLVGVVNTAKDYDFVNNDTDAQDDDGHGSHVAGTVAAVTNNSIGVASVGGNALQILPVKVLDGNGSGYYSDISEGIMYAADNGAKVVNLSLGGRFSSSTLKSAVDYAWNKDVVIVAAAGNSNTSSAFYPASYTNVMAVAASDQNDKKAWFSNYGNWIDIAAPGVSILSTTGGGYQSWNGTSMASPHVAGLAGLLFSANDLANNSQVRQKIESKADPMPLEKQFTRGRFGKGRINVYKALTQ